MKRANRHHCLVCGKRKRIYSYYLLTGAMPFAHGWACRRCIRKECKWSHVSTPAGKWFTVTRLTLFFIGVGVVVVGFLPLWLLTLWAQPTSLLAFVHNFCGTVMFAGVVASAFGALFMPEHYFAKGSDDDNR